MVIYIIIYIIIDLDLYLMVLVIQKIDAKKEADESRRRGCGVVML